MRGGILRRKKPIQSIIPAADAGAPAFAATAAFPEVYARRIAGVFTYLVRLGGFLL